MNNEHHYDIEGAFEDGRLEARLSAAFYGNDKDDKRDREVASAIKNLNYQRVREELSDIVGYVLEAIYDNPRYQRLVTMPHYAKIKEDIITDIYLKHYSK